MHATDRQVTTLFALVKHLPDKRHRTSHGVRCLTTNVDLSELFSVSRPTVYRTLTRQAGGK